jgi:hypothetical protein
MMSLFSPASHQRSPLERMSQSSPANPVVLRGAIGEGT